MPEAGAATYVRSLPDSASSGMAARQVQPVLLLTASVKSSANTTDARWQDKFRFCQYDCAMAAVKNGGD